VVRSLPEGYRALVFGASGAIGSALVHHLATDPRCAQVLALGRNTAPAVDFDDEESVAAAAATLKPLGPWHCIINAAGALHGAFGMPERRLDQLNYAHMQALYRINAMGPALLLANFAPLLPRRDPGVFAMLSAKVGSIADNRLGGWYSYRASKAALNMIVKTAAIEVARNHPLAVLVALHPGTVRSALSEPFNGATIGRPADEAAADLLNVLDGLTPADTGNFYSYDGKRLPW
jgi:NAD(P)-dependent dehydrogenase (short-subunit alcohol dehydrogenase family)